MSWMAVSQTGSKLAGNRKATNTAAQRLVGPSGPSGNTQVLPLAAGTASPHCPK
jgi:hypothetical protein